MTFTEDELETIKNLIDDWGWEYKLKADSAKVLNLAKKLKMESYVKLYEDFLK